MAYEQPSNDTPQLFIIYREDVNLVAPLGILLEEAYKGFPGVVWIEVTATDGKQYSVWHEGEPIDDFLNDMTIFVVEGKTFVELYAIDLEIHDPFEEGIIEMCLVEFCVFR